MKPGFPRLVGGLMVLLMVGGGLALYIKRDHDQKQREAQALADRLAAEREERRHQDALNTVARAQEESASLIPRELGGVAIGMTQDELLSKRPGMNPRGSESDGFFWLEDTLPNGALLKFGLEPRTHRLLQIQVLSTISRGEDFTAHLQHMNREYGTPSGAWNCMDEDGIPMRRFTWRKALTTVMDVFMIYGDRASNTLIFTPSEIAQQSLERGRCNHVTGSDVAEFPQVPADKIDLLLGRNQAAAAAAASAGTRGPVPIAAPQVDVQIPTKQGSVQ